MNKTELAAAISEEKSIASKTVALVLESFFETVAVTLENGGEVNISNFGSFKAVPRAARTGRNPQTGEVIDISAGFKITF